MIGRTLLVIGTARREDLFEVNISEFAKANVSWSVALADNNDGRGFE